MYSPILEPKKSGFSLIEAIMGTAVLSIVFLSLPPAFMSIRTMNAATESQQRSSNLVTSELEYLRTLEFSSLETFASSNRNPSTRTMEHPSRSNITYTITTDIANGNNELDGMLDATVTVSWTENKRKRETVGRTFFAQNGMSDKKFPNAN